MDNLQTCRLYSLGTVEYEAAWHYQEQLAAEVARGEPPALLLLEHPHTYTLGRSGKDEHLLWGASELTRRGVSVFHVDRGGDITYHGPGQLVGYPILRLAAPGWQGERLPRADFVGHIRRLEQMLILALRGLGLEACTRPGLSGVWIPSEVMAGRMRHDLSAGAVPNQPGKIASIGVKVDVNGVSRHGFALNVHPDMNYWQGIVACGLDGVQMVSLADFFEPCPSMAEVSLAVELAFTDIFEMSLNPVEYIPILDK
jgi:lipoate-protein ligase B